MQAAVQIKLLGAMQGALEAAQSAVGVLWGAAVKLLTVQRRSLAKKLCRAVGGAAARSGKGTVHIAVQGVVQAAVQECDGDVWQRCCAG